MIKRSAALRSESGSRIRCVNSIAKGKQTMSTSRGEFVMSGYLTKSPPESRIKVAQWHRRWFLLMDSRLVYPLADRYVRLEYYQSEVDAKRLADPKGVINLKSCTEVKERDPIKGHKFAFDICTFERVYHLACETGEERKVWIDTLNTLLFEEPRKQNSPGGRRHSPPQQRAAVVRRIRESSVKLQRPLSFTGSPTNSFERNSSHISTRPLPSLPIDKAAVRKSRPLPPTPAEEDLQLPGVQIHQIGLQKSPIPARKKKGPPPRPVPYHLSHSNVPVPVPPARSTSQPSVQTINDHYEVGPGQMIVIPQNNVNKKSPLPKAKRRVPPSRSLDETVHFTNANGNGILSDQGQQQLKVGEGDDYSILENIEAAGYDPNNADYSHLGLVDGRDSPPPPPPPVRHSSRQTSSSYENLSYLPSPQDDGDYCHLKHS